MEIAGVRISKKLSVLIGSGFVWFLQGQGVDVTSVADQIINTPLDSMVQQTNDPNNELIAYLGGGYIAIQGLIDMVKEWRKHPEPITKE